MTLSPRTLVSFVSVKACLTGAEWLLRGARALHYTRLLGSTGAGVLRWSNHLTRTGMRMWRHERARHRSRRPEW
jgi:hypothetical protein